VLIIGINDRPELSAVGPYTAGLAEHLVRLPRPAAILGVVSSLSGGVLVRISGDRLRAPCRPLFHDHMGSAALPTAVAVGNE